MRVLVMGGTGFVGPHIVRRLHDLGHEVTVVHRGRTEADLPAAVRHIHVDVEGARSRAYLGGLRAEFARLVPDVALDMMPATEDDARAVMAALRGLAGRPAIIVEEGMARWRWTRDYSENVAEAVVLAVTDPQAAGQVYNVGEEAALTTAEWIRAIGEAAGWSGAVIAVPTGELPAGTQHGMHVEHDLAVDTTKIRRELGYAELVPRPEALARTVAWERQHPPEGELGRAPDYAAEDEVLARLSRPGSRPAPTRGGDPR